MPFKPCENGNECTGEPLPEALYKAAKDYGNPYSPLRRREPEVDVMMHMLEQAHPSTLQAMQEFVADPPNNPTAVLNELATFRVLCANCTECPRHQSK